MYGHRNNSWRTDSYAHYVINSKAHGADKLARLMRKSLMQVRKSLPWLQYDFEKKKLTQILFKGVVLHTR